jgi:hypothetical protein
MEVTLILTDELKRALTPHRRGREAWAVTAQRLLFQVAARDDQLFSVRHAFLEVLPGELYLLASKVISLKEDDRLWEFLHEVVVATVALGERILAEQGPADVLFDNPDRVPCPLCGRVPDGPYPSPGFTVPEGLTRHLEGRHPARECVVMEVLREWGREVIHTPRQQRNAE